VLDPESKVSSWLGVGSWLKKVHIESSDYPFALGLLRRRLLSRDGYVPHHCSVPLCLNSIAVLVSHSVLQRRGSTLSQGFVPINHYESKIPALSKLGDIVHLHA
jgi:hypothetical protein